MSSEKKDFAKEYDLGDIDVSIADALRYKLLENPDVVFAGVIPPHPLFGKVVIKILMRDNYSEEAIIKAARELKNSINAILEEVSSSLKSEGEIT
ncbi:MAG: RpoL/Rpb11 RNA polymerase subunit family protein [Nitrososphaeria archaeon]